MTPRERLLTVLAGGVPDRVPATIHQWQAYHLREFMGGMTELEAFSSLGLDAVCYPFGLWDEQQFPNWREERAIVDRGDGSFEVDLTVHTPDGPLTQNSLRNAYTETITEHMIKEPEDAYLIRDHLPVPRLDQSKVRAYKNEIGDSGILRTFTNGPQGSPWQDACVYGGTEGMIYRSFDMPEWTHEFLSILLDKKLEFYEKNIKPLRGVFEMIETGGGAASSTVISPAMFEEFCLPYDQKQHEYLKSVDRDLTISYHTCGGMLPLLDSIPENGCDFSETLSPVSCGGDIRDDQDEQTVKEKLGPRVGLMGGFNQIQVLTEGTPEQVRADVLRCIRHYAPGGGYIMMCADHFFHAPAENLKAYAQAAAELGGY
jgi:hypothetical protein